MRSELVKDVVQPQVLGAQSLSLEQLRKEGREGRMDGWMDKQTPDNRTGSHYPEAERRLLGQP